MGCKKSDKQITVSSFFRDRESNETLRAWIRRKGNKVPCLPLPPIEERVTADLKRGVLTWIPVGPKVWGNEEILGFTDAVSEVKLDELRPDVFSFELFLKNGQPGLWTIRICGCAEVIAHRENAGPPCRNLGEHNCPLLRKVRRKKASK